MGLSEESVHVLTIHMIKKKMNNDFQRFGNELTAYVKKNNFRFSRIISEKRKKKTNRERERESGVNELI